MPKRDYYEILNISRNVEPDALKKAYRQLARKWHPDVNKAKNAHERFSEIQEAYDVLSDPEKRKQYDRFGHVGIGAGAGGGGNRGGGNPYSWSSGPASSGGPDLGSIFEELFGGGGGGGGARHHQHQQHQPPRQGENLHHAITITFQTAMQGGTEQIRIASTTVSNQSQTIDITIPPGIENNAKLRIRGKGHPGQNSQNHGDLILTVTVGEHPYYKRNQLDIILELPITIAEAVLGTTITIPTLKGQVDLKIPPGAQNGQKLRIPKHGITPKKGNPGNFLIIIQVKTPTELEPADLEFFESLQERLPTPRLAPPWS